ncbi:hypothetical protein ACX1C1_09535 [Paenibacillus sp. strain BS8-2]
MKDPAHIRTFIEQTGISEVHVGSGVRMQGSYRNGVDPDAVRRLRAKLKF